MTHPDRIDLARELQAQIGTGDIVGTYQESLWGAAKVAWLSYNPRKTHHLVIQDDVWANDSLVEDTEFLLNLFDEEVALSLADNRPANGVRWKKSFGVNNGRALVLPTKLIPKWILWCENNILPDFSPDDIRLAIYLREHRIPILHPNPPLAYQRLVPSIYQKGKIDRNKQAHIGDASVHDFDWVDGKVRDWSKNKLQVKLTHQWAMGRLHLLYAKDAKFSNPNILKSTNIEPFDSLEKTQDIIGTRKKTALLIPSFDDMPPFYYRTLEAGKYQVVVRATVGHVLGGTGRIPKDAKHNNVKVKPGGGAGVVELWAGDDMVHQLKVGVYYNTATKSQMFQFELHETKVLQVKVWSHVWGNMAVQFQYRFAKIPEIER